MLDFEISYKDKNLYCKIYKDDIISISLENIKKSFYNKYSYEELIIDITECNYIDSTSVGKIISLNRKVEDINRKMTILCCRRILEVITSLSLHTLINVQEYTEGIL